MEFEPNEYFTNIELTKIMIADKDDQDDYKESKGTDIDWKEGKNVTVKTIKKKQKNKSKIYEKFIINRNESS